MTALTVAEDEAAACAALRALREDKIAGYSLWLAKTALSEHTKTAYVRQVRHFIDWLHAHPEHSGQGITDSPHRRDYAVRDYKRHLLVIEAKAPATVNLALAAIDSAFAWDGFDRTTVSREPLPKRAPKALTEDEARRALRVAEQRHEVRTPRDYGLVYLLLHTGLRIGEAHALNIDDVQVTARTGRVIVRAGKGDRYREVPLGPKTRPTFDALVKARRSHHQDEPAVFINHSSGRRLGVSSLDYIIREVGKAAGIAGLSAHTFRHTFGTRLVRAGVDLVTVAELMGHSSIETTRRYALPDDAAMQSAVDHAHVEH